MKTTILCSLMIVFSLSVYSQQKSPNIEGTWKLVQHQSITGKTIVTNYPGKSHIDATKIWSGNNFMFISRHKADTTVSDWYGVGTYKLAGNKYEEHIRLINYEPWVGKTVKMTLVMKNDTIVQTYPVDDKGQPDKDGATIEKYIKLKK